MIKFLNSCKNSFWKLKGQIGFSTAYDRSQLKLLLRSDRNVFAELCKTEKNVPWPTFLEYNSK